MEGSVSVPSPQGSNFRRNLAVLGMVILAILVSLYLAKSSIQVRATGPLIVVVDDEEFGEMLAIALRQLGYTVDLYDDCDEIVFKKRTVLYFVDENGYTSGSEYCIPKILRVHVRPIILMSAGDMSNLRLPDGVEFMRKEVDVFAWIDDALRLVGLKQ